MDSLCRDTVFQTIVVTVFLAICAEGCRTNQAQDPTLLLTDVSSWDIGTVSDDSEAFEAQFGESSIVDALTFKSDVHDAFDLNDVELEQSVKPDLVQDMDLPKSDIADSFSPVCEPADPANASQCFSDNDCPQELHCHPKFFVCVECFYNSHCEDQNQCTKDECNFFCACQHETWQGPCDDGNPCTVGDKCVDGECVSGTETLDCDDDNVCTLDSCDPSQGCVNTPVQGECDDTDPCTDNDYCVNGVCIGSKKQCQDLLPCTIDFCQDGECVHEPTPGLSCDDGNLCTENDICTEDGTCQGTPIICEDNNPCTYNLCDPDFGCKYTPLDNVPCDDKNPCTQNDLCVQGQCVGTGIICQDDNQCTLDTCDPETLECLYIPQDGIPCDDGNVCTESDTCVNGNCKGIEKSCDDLNPCTDDYCEPDVGCVNEFNQAPCDDGNECTVNDRCKLGKCVAGQPLVCDDNNPCTNDGCDPQTGCFHSPNTAPCDDGNQCTIQDFCEDGVCHPGELVTCDDGNPCTNDFCDPAIGCVYEPNAQDCDDGNQCTINDKCTNGQCLGQPLSCDDGNPCTTDQCDPATGCVYINNTKSCDDGDKCTKNDICQDGKCVGGDPVLCDDGNPCTDDTCIPSTGCIHTNNDANPCTDNNACTVGDHCKNGACVGSEELDCDDGNECTDDLCDPDVGCVHEYNSAPCEDGDLCTTGDKCNNGVCVGGAPINCDDGNPCTNDSCNPQTGCVHSNKSGPCDDGNNCTEDDKCVNGECVGEDISCDDGNPCTLDLCDPTIGCVYENLSNLPCDDQNACTQNDHCSSGQCTGTQIDCDDGNICTTNWCNPVTGCVSVNNSKPCDDGNECTEGDQCQNGSCVSGTPKVCDDADPCTEDSCDPTVGCVFTQIPNCGTCKNNCWGKSGDCWCDWQCVLYKDCCPDVCDYCDHLFCSCTPNCEDKECGPDGCGGTCGECPDGYYCKIWEGKCYPCSCQGKECGFDQCGNLCGKCPPGQQCVAGKCIGWPPWD